MYERYDPFVYRGYFREEIVPFLKTVFAISLFLCVLGVSVGAVVWGLLNYTLLTAGGMLTTIFLGFCWSNRDMFY